MSFKVFTDFESTESECNSPSAVKHTVIGTTHAESIETRAVSLVHLAAIVSTILLQTLPLAGQHVRTISTFH